VGLEEEKFEAKFDAMKVFSSCTPLFHVVNDSNPVLHRVHFGKGGHRGF
jgi:hypothetical protein